MPSLAERVLLVALGGGAGSVLRYLAAVWFGAGPLTTFVVNITGSFLIGLLVAATPSSDVRVRLLLASGFLGGYTTFSAWQLEALISREWTATAAILLGSMVGGFAAVTAGYWLGSRFASPA